jgi:hypothetical protein
METIYIGLLNGDISVTLNFINGLGINTPLNAETQKNKKQFRIHSVVIDFNKYIQKPSQTIRAV